MSATSNIQTIQDCWAPLRVLGISDQVDVGVLIDDELLDSSLRALQIKFHPDRTGADSVDRELREEKFKAVRAAYETVKSADFTCVWCGAKADSRSIFWEWISRVLFQIGRRVGRTGLIRKPPE